MFHEPKKPFEWATVHLQDTKGKNVIFKFSLDDREASRTYLKDPCRTVRSRRMQCWDYMWRRKVNLDNCLIEMNSVTRLNRLCSFLLMLKKLLRGERLKRALQSKVLQTGRSRFRITHSLSALPGIPGYSSTLKLQATSPPLLDPFLTSVVE